MQQKELIVIGGGPAGMAAALSAYENGCRDILILERDQFLGGILNQCIHPGFGLHYFQEELTGPEYADRFIQKIKAIPEINISLKSFVVNIAPNPIPSPTCGGREQGKGAFIITYLKPGKLEQLKAKTIIMATGCREKTREMVHIPGTRPAGIFSAGLAQKLINIEGLLPGKEVIVIGSGDIGLIMARRFTLEGAKVKAVLEIQAETRGLIRNVVQCLEDFDIPLYFNHQVTQIHGQARVTGITVKDLATGKEFEMSCDTVLISVGLIPEIDLVDGLGKVTGLFFCGNADHVYDLVDNVTKDSIKTGKAAAEYLK